MRLFHKETIYSVQNAIVKPFLEYLPSNFTFTTCVVEESFLFIQEFTIQKNYVSPYI